MKVELHAHTSRYSACSMADPDELLTRLVECGYEAVFLTEHQAIWPANDLAELQERFPQIRIFSGVELSDRTHPQDLLVLGTDDPVYCELAWDGQWAEVLSRARANGHLTVLAHPCRYEGGHQLLLSGLRPDAMEFRSCNHDPSVIGQAKQLARRHKLPTVNAGDLHAISMAGYFWVETDQPLVAPGDLRQAVLAGAYRNREGSMRQWKRMMADYR